MNACMTMTNTNIANVVSRSLFKKELGPCGACSLFSFAATTEKLITEHFWLGALAKD